MAFGSFKTLAEVARLYQITLRREAFVQPQPYPVDERVGQRLAFCQANAPVDASEGAICEFYLAPILQEIWLPYADTLTIWSHVSFNGDDALSGFPDYFFARRSPLGPIIREEPYVLFVEAKKDDFDGGWGQCLAAMLAAQKLNGDPGVTIYGGVSNGRTWYFGKLDGQTLTQDPREFTVADLPGLFAALNYIFQQAKQEVLAATR
jgi:hypothetical protein